MDTDDKLVQSIEIFQPNNIMPFKTFDLSYYESVATVAGNAYSNTDTKLKYRPFLTELKEKSSSSINLYKKHLFEYDDLNNLPPRLSYAQDHYGFFNGILDNTTLMPLPILSDRIHFPLATARRETDGTYASKGQLKKITYPTGGYDEIFYEANTVNKDVVVPPPTIKAFVTASADQLGIAGNASQIITVGTVSPTTLYASCSAYGTGIHNKMFLYLYIVNSNPLQTLISQQILPGNAFQAVLNLAAGVSYELKIRVTSDDNPGHPTIGAASFDYYQGTAQVINMNEQVGGVRVSKIITNDIYSGKSSVKKYYYSLLSTLDKSSGGILYEPVYKKRFEIKNNCDYGNPANNQLPSGTFNSCQYEALYSNSLTNLFLYSGSPVYYSSVVEGFGEDFENGGIEHHYILHPAYPANLLNGSTVLGIPFTNFEYDNGLETYQHVFKKKIINTTTSYTSVKKIFTNYKDDSRFSTVFPNYVAAKRYSVVLQFSPPQLDEENAYDLAKYLTYRKWIYPEKVTTQYYATDGTSYIEDIVNYVYENQLHTLPTQIITKGSDGILKTVHNYYPQDITLSGTAEIARNLLISKNVLSPILKQTVEKNNTTLITLLTEYKEFYPGLVMPNIKYSSVRNSPLKERMIINYSPEGKLIEQYKPNDVHEVYLWGYNNAYPVAKILGSDYNTVKQYISQNILDNPLNDVQLRTELDKIRIGLQGTKALITTYTYSPLIGITSETDTNGKTIYYEYDLLGRLKLIRDKDGNILKTIEYKYQQ